MMKFFFNAINNRFSSKITNQNELFADRIIISKGIMDFRIMLHLLIICLDKQLLKAVTSHFDTIDPKGNSISTQKYNLLVDVFTSLVINIQHCFH